MTSRHDFDDPHGYHRRWERLEPDAVDRAARRDPLLFLADRLAAVVERVGHEVVDELGVLHHRRGSTHVIEVDRRWQQALSDVCHYYGLDAVGVLARTESGAIVRPSAPPTAP